MIGISKKKHTSLYVSITDEDDIFIDNLRIKKIKDDKENFTKQDIIKHLMALGKDVINEKYLKLDPSVDNFVSKLQNYVIEISGEKITMKKSKEQVYYMLIEKGLQNLSEE